MGLPLPPSQASAISEAARTVAAHGSAKVREARLADLEGALLDLVIEVAREDGRTDLPGRPLVRYLDQMDETLAASALSAIRPSASACRQPGESMFRGSASFVSW